MTVPAADYVEQVNKSISFSGLTHDFFVARKATWLRRVAADVFEDLATVACLDVGCGVGIMHEHLTDWIGKLVGVDIVEDAIRQAAQRNPGNTYITYDGTRLPFPDGSFDLCTMMCVVHHLPPAGRADVLAEMYRVVRPGGLAVVIEHNPLNPLTRCAVARCAFDRGAVLVTSWETRRLLAQAGFSDLHVDYLLFTPIQMGWAERLDRMLRFVWFGAQYGVTARRP